MTPRLKYLVLFCSIMFGGWIAVALAQDSMAAFGLKVDELEKYMVESLANGYIPAYPDKKVFKAASPAVRAAFVRNTLNWFKSYTETDAFKKDYAQQRASAKPAPPKASTADEKYAAQLAEQRQGLEKMRQEVAQMPPDMQKQMQPVLKQMEAEMEKQAKDPKMVELMKQGYEQENVSEQESYQNQMATWENKYPENPKVLIASRLHQFMDVSQSVDFDARMVQKGKLMKFADPQYESQTSEWKLCYRAGREPVQAARALVGEWLAQLEKE